MSQLIQLAFLAIVLQDVIFAKPLFEGISVKKNFEINFKPMPRKPITFVSEKWSPFGIFKKRHSIEKRSVEVVPVAVAPVEEHVDDIEHIDPPFLLVPTSVQPIMASPVAPSTMIPVITTPIPPILIANEAPIVEITPPPKSEAKEPPSPFPLDTDEIVLPIVVPPLSSNLVILTPENDEGTEVKSPGLYTDISKAEPVKEFLETTGAISPVPVVEESIPPVEPKPEEPKPVEEPPKVDITLPGPIVRGTKMALYFGNIFLQLMTQFLTNARATIDQLSSPPVYKE